MITEADALETAQIDAKGLYAKLEAGALPEDLARLVIRRILFRIKQFGRDKATNASAQASTRKMTAPTFSELLTSRCVTTFLEATRYLPSEDSRALALWMVGTPPQVPGFLRHAVMSLTESSADQAVTKAEEYITALLSKMHQTDDVLFNESIKVLTGPRQRIVRGLLMDAQWAFAERDGLTARSRVISARRIARRWLDEKKGRDQDAT